MRASLNDEIRRLGSPVFSDFGGFSPSRPHTICRVSSLDELRQNILDCVVLALPMRTRCFAHSMNGMAVPRREEVLFDLTAIRHVKWTGRGSIIAGAGLAIWELDQYIRQFGWKLPVTNDGGASAPSVGGFIAAGGIGEGCRFYGGFWETVSRLVVVTGAGDVRRIGPTDPLFPWIFGSMGALGVVYEAEIKLVPVSDARPQIVPDSTRLPEGPRTSWPPHIWLTLFVTENQRNDALAFLTWLADNNPEAWSRRSAYEYFLQFRRFNPPLIFGAGTDFIALGIWGDRAPHDQDLHGYLALEAEFQAVVEARGWHRYYQSELIWSCRPLERYVGTDCAAAFRQIKITCDPAGLLNAFMAPA